jgi:hypothetical protein
VVEDDVRLSSALEALRCELETAWSTSQGRRIRFRSSEVTLTLETIVRLDKESSGGIRWYVVQAGGGVKSGTERTQTLVLTLTPYFYDDTGNSIPLDVAAIQTEPGQ